MLSVHHFSFTVSNLDRTLDFYMGLFGFALRSRSFTTGPGLGEALFGRDWGPHPDYVNLEVARLDLNGINVHFHEYHTSDGLSYCPIDPSAVGSSHIAVQVKNLDVERARLQKAGVQFHAPADWFNESGKRPWKWCYLRDPDGIIVELVEEVPADIQLKVMADRIREARLARGLTLQEVAEKSGTSPAHLSQIERGRSVPSVGVMLDISHALTLAPDYFFRHEEPLEGTGGGRVVQPRNAFASEWRSTPESPAIHDSADHPLGVTWQELACGGNSVQVLRLHLDVGMSADEGGSGEDGQECGTVLQGTLLVELTDSKHVLETGSSVTYDRRALCRLLNVGRVPVVGVWTILGDSNPLSRPGRE